MCTFYGYLFSYLPDLWAQIFSSAILFRFCANTWPFQSPLFHRCNYIFHNCIRSPNSLWEPSPSSFSRGASSCFMYTNSRLWNYNKKRKTQQRLPNSGRAFRSVNVQSWNEKAANIFDRLSCGVLSVCEQFLQNIKKACRTLSETICRKKKAGTWRNQFIYVRFIDSVRLVAAFIELKHSKLYRGTF